MKIYPFLLSHLIIVLIRMYIRKRNFKDANKNVDKTHYFLSLKKKQFSITHSRY